MGIAVFIASGVIGMLAALLWGVPWLAGQMHRRERRLRRKRRG